MAPGSVSVWLEDLKNGDESTSQEIWNRYVERLIQLARRKMASMQKRICDEEDLVATAFASFFMGVRANRFSKLHSRDDLWKVLVMLTERRIVDRLRKELAEKRGGGKIRGESVFGYLPNGIGESAIQTVIDDCPTPEFATLFAEEVAAGIGKLQGDSLLQNIVLLKLQGFTNNEVADQTKRSVRTIERKLRLIRELWIR